VVATRSSRSELSSRTGTDFKSIVFRINTINVTSSPRRSMCLRSLASTSKRSLRQKRTVLMSAITNLFYLAFVLWKPRYRGLRTPVQAPVGNPVRLAETDSKKVSRTVSFCGKGCPRLIDKANQGGEFGLYSVSKPLSASAETRTLSPSLRGVEWVNRFPLVFDGHPMSVFRRLRNRGIIRVEAMFQGRRLGPGWLGGRRSVSTRCVARPAKPVGRAGKLRQFGEDISELLEYIPENFRVIRHMRPKFSCTGCDRVVEESAPSRPLGARESGIARLKRLWPLIGRPSKNTHRTGTHGLGDDPERPGQRA
jgi:zinc-finger binding domain of transposase IS66